MIELSLDEAMTLKGCLETIIAEAEEMPQVGGNEATIIEQAEAGIEILDREIAREGGGGVGGGRQDRSKP